MATQQNNRLSSQDAAFLYFERPDLPMAVCSLAIYEGSISYECFLDHMESRLPKVPRFRQRLAFVPLNLAHPTWEDDPDFDIRRHVKHAPLPAPGTDEQLRALATELFAPGLDRGKPVWEMYVIDGLQGDRTAILSKAHHCMVDGTAGAEMLAATLDLSPELVPPPERVPWRPRALPSLLLRLRWAIRARAEQKLELLRIVWSWLLNPQPGIRRLRAFLRFHNQTEPWMARLAPKTTLTRRLTRDRRLAFGRMPLAEIRRVREAFGGSMNDVFMAALTGALRSHLLARGEDVLGEEPRIGMPVSIRPRNHTEAGNLISGMMAQLPVGQADPVQRLRIIRSRMYALKKERQAEMIGLFMQVVSHMPPPLQFLGARLPVPNRFFNVSFSSAADIRVPLYLFGHRMVEHYAPTPLVRDVGLGVAVLRYGDDLFWSVTAEPNALPDLDAFAYMLRGAFEELLDAAAVKLALAVTEPVAEPHVEPVASRVYGTGW